ncbi:MAG TPA: hypothetical protein VFH49_15005, partial [Aquabacterium sp.]|nr:hypothetical protein [Aquabacterium sp.]
HVHATAADSINLTEISGALNVGQIHASAGDVILSVRDSLASGEDLLMDAAADITAGDTILLQAGDNVALDAGSTVVAGTRITLHSGTGDTGNVDAVGTTITIENTLDAVAIEIAGERQDDVITLRPTLIVGHTRVLGDTDGLAGGDDLIIVDRMSTMQTTHDRLDDAISAQVRDTVDLDGRGGTDTYVVYTHGSDAVGTHDYILNVLDSGAKNDGLDTLNIDGTAADDIFLLRKVAALVEGQSTPMSDNDPAFVALLHGTLDQVRDPNAANRRQDVERINYDENINSRLVVRGLSGDDYFASDDNSAITTLDGGAGADEFQIGQIYGSPRISIPAGSDPASVADGDAFDTIETTAGFLSRGASVGITAYGGTGNDKFTVYSNKAELRLEGNDDNDEFVIRAFALVGQDGVSTEGDTEALGGSGDDVILYNVNAPVDLDGGAGFDKVVVIGTEFNDNFAISDEGVFGAGLNVKYDNIEAVDVDGLEGDDHFFVQSTKAGVITTIIGGNGSDTFDVAGDVTEPIVSM